MTDSYERLFFALWPDPGIRKKLSSAFKNLGGVPEKCKPVVPSNLHLTLHFLGNVPVSNVNCFLQQAAKVRGRAFELNINRTGHFKKARVLWLGCETVPPALYQLHTQLADLIQACGFFQESRHYQPHVTMAQKISEPVDQKNIMDIRWFVDRFALISSHSVDTGVEYRVKALYALKN